jgi:hypothetical protein
MLVTSDPADTGDHTSLAEFEGWVGEDGATAMPAAEAAGSLGVAVPGRKRIS